MKKPEIVKAPVVAAVGAFAASSAVTGFVVKFTVALVLSFVAQALTPKPKLKGRANFAAQGIIENVREADSPHQFVYGEIRKGGTITYMEATGTNNRFLHQIIVLAGHEVDSIGDIYINDQVVTLNGSGVVTSAPWANRIRVKKHTGSPSQSVDPDLLAESKQIDEAFRGRGIAYLYVRFEYNADTFASGVPLVTAVVKGKKVYDPRDTSTAWNANAALCIRDYLLADYGLADTRVNDTVFAVAANVSDEAVTLAGGGTEPRYEINGVISSETPIGQVLEEMTTACAGSLFWGQGEWQLKVGYYTSPVATFTLGDLRGPISMATRVNTRDNFNAVQGSFNDAAQDYITADYPAITSAAFLAEDGGEEAVLDFQLPLTTSAAAAQRLAKVALFRGREQITFSADFGLAAFGVQVGDIVALTLDRYGWTAKEFEVVGWRFFTNGEGGDLRVNLTLRETSEAAFDWTAEEAAIIANNTSLLSFTETAPVGLSVASETVVINEKVTNRFRLTVTSGAPSQVDRVEVQFKGSAESDWRAVGVGQLGLFEVSDAEAGDYDFRARSINGFGYRGEWEFLFNVPAADVSQAPGDVAGFISEVGGATTYLEWNSAADFDLSYYRIRHAVETSGATWANATTAIDKVPRPATSATVPTRPGTYMIRAYDKTGLASINFASAVVLADEIEAFANTGTQTESPTFSGTKTGCTVASSALRITDPSAGPSSATYDFSAVIDTAAARRARVRVDVTVSRLDDGSGLWDDLPGLFDNLPGNFDDFTGSAQFADTDVETWVSTTPDDPSGSPTWSDYRRIRSAEIYGRAFRFRVVLKSTSDNVTPAISALSAIVEYN